jgi:hypothetical protein
MKSNITILFLSAVILALGFFTSFTQTDWTKHSGPVLTPGPAGDWDENNLLTSSVLFDGSMYHLWYDNYNVAIHQFEHIGYATSNDGISWTKYNHPMTTNPPFSQSDPVLNPGPGNYDSIGVGHPCVRKYNNIYHMWYTGDSHSSGTRGMTICHATSSDGIIWSKDPANPVLNVGFPGMWDERWVSTADVVFDGSIYHMIYSAWDGIYPPNQVRLGHATSEHPDSAWIKDPNNPILDIGTPTCWDYDRVDAPCFVFDGYRFHMFYSGGTGFYWRIGYAWSQDGSHWTKYDNPSTTIPWLSISDFVLDWGDPVSFDDRMVSDGSVLLDTLSDSLKLWYTGLNEMSLITQIGYAAAPFDTSFLSGIDELSGSLSSGFLLKQNYPNPFNPGTVISWQLAVSSSVKLTIYSITGQEVTVLVNERQAAGQHSILWNASDFASGVYLYRLEADGYVETRKMILMK